MDWEVTKRVSQDLLEEEALQVMEVKGDLTEEPWVVQHSTLGQHCNSLVVQSID